MFEGFLLRPYHLRFQLHPHFRRYHGLRPRPLRNYCPEKMDYYYPRRHRHLIHYATPDCFD